jgi:DNA repair protein RadC
VLITRRLKEALALIRVGVLDCVVVGADGCVSFVEQGLFT